MRKSAALKVALGITLAVFVAGCIVALTLGLYYGLDKAPCTAACPPGLSCPIVQGACTQCSSRAECAGSDGCIDGMCRPACLEDAQCSDGTRCFGGYCLECTASTQCTNAKEPICGPQGQCQACSVNANCGSGQTCVQQLGQCQAQCTLTPCASGMQCQGHTCLQCIENANCSPAMPACGELGQCQQCTNDGQCEGAGQVCIDGTCQFTLCPLPMQTPGETEAFVIYDSSLKRCLQPRAPNSSFLELEWTTQCSGNPSALFAYRDSTYRSSGLNVSSVVHLDTQTYVQAPRGKEPVILNTDKNAQPSVKLLSSGGGFSLSSNGLSMDPSTLQWTSTDVKEPLFAQYAGKGDCGVTPNNVILGAQLLSWSGSTIAHYLAHHKASGQAWLRAIAYLPNDHTEFEPFTLAEDSTVRTVSGLYLQDDLKTVGHARGVTARVRSTFWQTSPSVDSDVWTYSSYNSDDVGRDETPVYLSAATGTRVPWTTLNNLNT